VPQRFPPEVQLLFDRWCDGLWMEVVVLDVGLEAVQMEDYAPRVHVQQCSVQTVE